MLVLVAIIACAVGLLANAADAQMIATGHSCQYKKNDHTAAVDAAEQNAIAGRRRLRADAEPVPPWEWRKGERGRNTVEVTR